MGDDETGDEALTSTIEEQLAEGTRDDPQTQPLSEQDLKDPETEPLSDEELAEEYAETSLDQPSDSTS